MSFKDRFAPAEEGMIYLDGNSLGRLPLAAESLARDLVSRQWGERLIRGWNDGWIHLPRRIGGKIGQIVGAQPGEVLIADSTSVNLYKLAIAALEARPERREIITESENFPSDLYILQGLKRRFPNLKITITNDPIAAISYQTALVSLSHVHFKSGFRHPMAEINSAAKSHGAWTLWDLSHSVGAVPVDLSTADMAVGCCYKYLNGGPGAPAFLYVRCELQAQMVNPIQGWFGQRNAFEFALEYEPEISIDRFAVGTPPILSLAMIEPGVDLILEAGTAWIDERRQALTAQLMAAGLERFGFQCVTPANPNQRGSHVTFAHPESWRINLALIQAGVIPDFRAPSNLRFGITPLYIDSTDIETAISRLETVMETRAYEQFLVDRPSVT